jgi:hypothetical protein
MGLRKGISIRGKRYRFYRNSPRETGVWFQKRNLPVRQTLVWAGPVFILIRPESVEARIAKEKEQA